MCLKSISGSVELKKNIKSNLKNHLLFYFYKNISGFQGENRALDALKRLELHCFPGRRITLLNLLTKRSNASDLNIVNDEPESTTNPPPSEVQLNIP